MKLPQAPNLALDPELSRTDRYVHGAQLALGGIVTLEGMAGIIQEHQANVPGLVFTFGLLSVMHAVTQLRGGYHRETIAPTGNIDNNSPS